MDFGILIRLDDIDRRLSNIESAMEKIMVVLNFQLEERMKEIERSRQKHSL